MHHSSAREAAIKDIEWKKKTKKGEKERELGIEKKHIGDFTGLATSLLPDSHPGADHLWEPAALW